MKRFLRGSVRMRRVIRLQIKIVTIVFLFFGSLAQGAEFSLENTKLFICHWRSAGSSFSLWLDATGKSALEISKKDFCRLDLDYISSELRSPHPGFRFSWTVARCAGEMKKFEKSFTEKIKMKLSLLQSPPVGRLAWVRDQDTTECSIANLRTEELHRHVGDWHKGSWGRKRN